MSTELEKRYYSEKEFCEMMGIKRKTAFNWRQKKLIGYMQAGRVIRYRASDIEAYERRTGNSPRKVKRES